MDEDSTITMHAIKEDSKVVGRDRVNHQACRLSYHIVNFPLLDGDVPRTTSYGAYISQLIRFAGVPSHFGWFQCP